MSALGFVLFALLSFVAEVVDSGLGMGYGTLLVPLLLLAGYQPLQVVPVILLAELCSGLSAGLSHTLLGNMPIRGKTGRQQRRVVLLMCGLGGLGAVTAAFTAVNISPFVLKTYIGCLVTVIGLIVLLTHKYKLKFTWLRLFVLGIIASFNKAISGGGYGPLVTSGQVLSGVEPKSAVATTSITEGVTCAFGLAVFFLSGKVADWSLAPPVVLGALCAVLPAAYLVKIVNPKTVRALVGFVAMALGAWVLVKTLL